jgi:hypothetical protein
MLAIGSLGYNRERGQDGLQERKVTNYDLRGELKMLALGRLVNYDRKTLTRIRLFRLDGLLR